MRSSAASTPTENGAHLLNDISTGLWRQVVQGIAVHAGTLCVLQVSRSYRTGQTSRQPESDSDREPILVGHSGCLDCLSIAAQARTTSSGVAPGARRRTRLIWARPVATEAAGTRGTDNLWRTWRAPPCARATS